MFVKENTNRKNKTKQKNTKEKYKQTNKKTTATTVKNTLCRHFESYRLINYLWSGTIPGHYALKS